MSPIGAKDLKELKFFGFMNSFYILFFYSVFTSSSKESSFMTRASLKGSNNRCARRKFLIRILIHGIVFATGLGLNLSMGPVKGKD